MRSTYLGSSNCPNTSALRANLGRALALVGGSLQVEEVNQDCLPQDDLRRGYPTPTILIDGHDLYGMPTPAHAASGCRVYPNGLPSADEIARLISIAISSTRTNRF